MNEYHKEAIGLAKLLFTVASAAAVSLIAWSVQNRQTEQEAFVVGAVVAAVILGAIASGILRWAWMNLNELKRGSG